MISKTTLSLIALAAAGFLPTAAQAVPMNYSFEQTGFDEGASVTGSFSAEDVNSDGVVSLDDGEIFDFSLDFSGNSLLEAFNLVFGDLTYFVYNLDGIIGEIFDDEGIDAMSGSGYQYAGGPGSFFTECGQGFDCAWAAGPNVGQDAFSAELISVSLDATDVPEPAAGLLLLTGLLGTGLLLQRRKA